jgi:hypothetical protein
MRRHYRDRGKTVNLAIQGWIMPVLDMRWRMPDRKSARTAQFLNNLHAASTTFWGILKSSEQNGWLKRLFETGVRNQ